jgi:outer membrane protein assembly factor BamB
VVADGLLYFSAYDAGPRRDLGNLFALDALSGEQQWCVTTGAAPRPTPIIADDLVLVGVGDLPWSPEAYGLVDGTRYVVALERATGIERWRFYHGGVGSDVLYTEGSVFVTTSEGGLWALEPATGSVRWLYQANPHAGFDEVSFGSPAVTNGVVYVTGGGLLHAVDAATGEMQWQVAVGDEEYPGRPVVANNVVYVSGSSGVYALETATGEERWRFAVSQAGWSAVVDGVLYVCSASTSEPDETTVLHAIDAESGEDQWQIEVAGNIARPAVVGDTIFIANAVESGEETVEGVVSAISTADGNELWRMPVEGAVTGPTVIGGMVYVGTETDVSTGSGEAGGLVAIGGTGGADKP